MPTFGEAGSSGYETSTWGGILAPAGMSKATVARLNAAINDILAMPDVRQKLQEAGLGIGGGSAQHFAD